MISDKDGSLLSDFSAHLAQGRHLAVMPIARTHLDYSVLEYPSEVTFYPSGTVDLEELNIHENSEHGSHKAEVVSALSGIDVDTLNRHNLVVFPFDLDWARFRNNSFRANLDLIRTLSEYVDKTCFDYVRYRLCGLFTGGDPTHCLPGRPGQVDSNHMMAGAMLYNPGKKLGIIIGGDAFTHIVTRGMGLPLESIDHNEFPKVGEVGNIVRHSLSLYGAMLEAQTPSSMFIQALALLEFLAFPDDYQTFKEVKKVIARYAAHSAADYNKILDRFLELTGKKDENTGRIIGYRTRLVHMGERLEDIVPEADKRLDLMVELDGYIRTIIDHMNTHSALELDEYIKERNLLAGWRKN